MRKKITEMHVSNIDVEKASLAKQQRWAELQTEEVEKLYAEIQSKLEQIQKEQWTAWDVESLKRVESILGDRRADEIRKDIERIIFFIFFMTYLILAKFTEYLDSNLWLLFLLVSAFWIQRLIEKNKES